MQKPWKHSTTDPETASRSPETVSSLGKRLKAKKRPRMTAISTSPTSRFLATPDATDSTGKR